MKSKVDYIKTQIHKVKNKKKLMIIIILSIILIIVISRQKSTKVILPPLDKPNITEKTKVDQPDFGETRNQVEKATKDVIGETTNLLKYIGIKSLKTIDDTLDDRTKEDIKTIGNGIKGGTKDIVEEVITEELKLKFKTIGDIIYNNAQNTIEEIKNNNNETN